MRLIWPHPPGLTPDVAQNSGGAAWGSPAQVLAPAPPREQAPLAATQPNTRRGTAGTNKETTPGQPKENVPRAASETQAAMRARLAAFKAEKRSSNAPGSKPPLPATAIKSRAAQTQPASTCKAATAVKQPKPSPPPLVAPPALAAPSAEHRSRDIQSEGDTTDGSTLPVASCSTENSSPSTAPSSSQQDANPKQKV